MFKEVLLASAALTLFPAITEAGSLEHLLELGTGLPFESGPDGSLVAKIGPCTVVVQDQQAEGFKVFSFDSGNSEAGGTGLTDHDKAALKAELRDPTMTTDELLSKLEHTKKGVVLKYLESLKSSCALTS